MLRALLKTMRPKQWAKNLFIFAPPSQYFLRFRNFLPAVQLGLRDQ
jgi:hypothetical protein